ncbi:MAG: homocysteine S-methyltransferase family protein [Candidatus Eisenbacteria bacterium]|uniref:Methionine synthase n=1 Tax=Eiseniibacteriota bacterium TaxID=2212470 RepID=A0A937X7N7_UNCEI|nr:homocysteine S-methyltransferase family protein [Candidatus Eisenbacteria bacterium]
MRRHAFQELLRERVLVCAPPGAAETLPAEAAEAPAPEGGGGSSGPPEMQAIDRHDELVAAHRAVLDAGADILLTLTAGANRPALSLLDAPGKLPEIIRRAMEAARSASAAVPRRDEGLPAIGFLLGVLPPAAGRQAGLTLEQRIEAYGEVVRIARAQEPDLFVVDASGELENLRAALIALRATAPEIPVVAQMTFGPDGRTVEGTPPAVVWAVARSLGADVVGATGALSPAEMLRVASAFAEVSDLPLIFQPSAVAQGRDAGSALSAQEFARQAKLLLAKGAAIVGCGGGHDAGHLRALARAAHEAAPSPREPLEGTLAASRTRDVEIGPRRGLVTIAEWPTLWGETRQAFAGGSMKGLARAVREALRADTQMLEVRCTLQPEEEPRFFDEFLPVLQSEVHLPLLIAAESRKGLEIALRRAVGRCLISGVTGERKTWERAFPLAREHGAGVVAACHAGTAMPRTAEERLAIARQILEAAIAAGVPAEDLLFDPVAVPAHTEGPRALDALRAIALIKAELGQATVLRLSRVSDGLPGRGRVESAFLAMAAAAGLDAAIVDPYNPRVGETALTASLLAGRDRESRRYLARFDKGETEARPAPAARGAGPAREPREERPERSEAPGRSGPRPASRERESWPPRQPRRPREAEAARGPRKAEAAPRPYEAGRGPRREPTRAAPHDRREPGARRREPRPGERGEWRGAPRTETRRDAPHPGARWGAPRSGDPGERRDGPRPGASWGASRSGGSGVRRDAPRPSGPAGRPGKPREQGLGARRGSPRPGGPGARRDAPRPGGPGARRGAPRPGGSRGGRAAPRGTRRPTSPRAGDRGRRSPRKG